MQHNSKCVNMSLWLILPSRGYLAPEYASLGQLSEKAEVYSFGVVCLEIVSGRRNVDNKVEPDEVVLTNRVSKLQSFVSHEKILVMF